MTTDTTRDAFEAHAAPMGFDLTRQYLAVPEPWSEYVNEQTSYFWAGYQAATEQGKRQPLTDGMIGEMSYYCGDVRGVRIDQFKFARAIEAAHGITATPQGNPS